MLRGTFGDEFFLAAGLVCNWVWDVRYGRASEVVDLGVIGLGPTLDDESGPAPWKGSWRRKPQGRQWEKAGAGAGLPEGHSVRPCKPGE